MGGRAGRAAAHGFVFWVQNFPFWAGRGQCPLSMTMMLPTTVHLDLEACLCERCVAQFVFLSAGAEGDYGVPSPLRWSCFLIDMRRVHVAILLLCVKACT